MSAFYMEPRPDTIAARARGAAIACGLALALAVLMTWPLASGLGHLGRTTNMDGLYGIWNVSWVSHAIVSDPASLFDANIFYPHRDTLAYSEANIVAGVIGRQTSSGGLRDPPPGWPLEMPPPRKTGRCFWLFPRLSSAPGFWGDVC